MKIVVDVKTFGDAAWFDLVVMDNDITEDIRLKILSGSPRESCSSFARRLAVALNAHYIEDGKELFGPYVRDAPKEKP